MLHVAEILLSVRVILSWVPAWNRTASAALLRLLTEPILMPLRGLAGIRSGPSCGFDFFPMLALLIIKLVRLLSRI